MKWNRKPEKKPNKPTTDEHGRPLQIVCQGPELLELCKRAKAGEFYIPSVTVQGKAGWIVNLSYPQEKPIF